LIGKSKKLERLPSGSRLGDQFLIGEIENWEGVLSGSRLKS